MKYLHTMVRIENIEESLDFYCNKLGLKETRRIENEKGKYTLICQKCGSKCGTDEKDTYMVCRKCPDYPKMQIQ